VCRLGACGSDVRHHCIGVVALVGQNRFSLLVAQQRPGLGAIGQPPNNSFFERLAVVCRALGLSPQEMAEKLGFDPATIQNCESKRHQPAKKRVNANAGVVQVR